MRRRSTSAGLLLDFAGPEGGGGVSDSDRLWWWHALRFRGNVDQFLGAGGFRGGDSEVADSGCWILESGSVGIGMRNVVIGLEA